MTSAPAQPKRYMWRRFIALIIDVLLIQVFFFGFLALAEPLIPGKVIVSAPISKEYCRPIDETPKLLEFAEMVDPALELPREFKLCTTSIFGLFEHTQLRVEVTTAEDETKRYSLRIGVYVDEDLNMITPFDFENIFMILTPLVYALYNFVFRATPGKNIVGIRLFNFGQKPSLLRLIGREYVRFAPFVVFSAASFSYSVSISTNNASDTVATLIQSMMVPAFWYVWIAIYIAGLLYYLIPFIRWRGRMPYDKWTGFEGVKRV